MSRRNITAYYSFGGGSLDGEALENALRTRESLRIETVNYAASGAGLTGHTASKLVVNADLQTIVDQDAGNNYETALGLGYGLLNFGYRFRLGRLRLYPLFGVGGGGIGLDLTPVTPGVAPATERHGLRLSRTNFLVHLGLGVELRFGGRVGMTIGGRIGYIFAPFSNREGIRGPYFRAFFGGSANI